MSGCNTLPKWLGIPAYFTGFNILLIVNPLWKISFWFYFCLLSKFYSPLFWGMAMHLCKQLWNNRKWNLNHGWIIEPQQLYFNFLDMQNFLQIASNSSLGDNLRIKALHFVSWLARIKPKVGWLDFSCFLFSWYVLKSLKVGTVGYNFSMLGKF